MPFFVACVSFWAVTMGTAAGSRLIGGYELHQLHGPFDRDDAAAEVTCSPVERVLREHDVRQEQPERVLLEAVDAADAQRQLLQLSLEQQTGPFPSNPD